MRMFARSTIAVTLFLTVAALRVGLAADAAGGEAQPKPADAPAKDANAAAPAPAPTPYGLTTVGGPFSESTSVQGKIDADLQGVWLLVARPQVVPGKWKTFPQLIKITAGKDGPEFHMLDVRLPPLVEQSVREANQKLAQWQPGDDVRKTLAASWSTLPRYEKKAVGEFIFDKITYRVVAKDGIDQLLPSANEETQKLREGGTLGIEITENYRPRTLPADNKVSQVMQRKTVYVAKSVAKDAIQGGAALGFLTAGLASPLPLQFLGDFSMYRIAPAS